MKSKEFLPTFELLEQYKKGRKDFSNIITRNGILTNHDFSGIIFKNAELEGVSFNGSDFTGADFSGAKIAWCGIRFTILKDAKFRGTMIECSSFEGAEFDNTDFIKARISNSNFIDTERFKANFDDATFYNVMWNISDVSALSLDEMKRKLLSAGISLDKLLYLTERLNLLEQKAFGNFGNKKEPEKSGYKINNIQTAETTKEGSYGSKGKYGGSSGGVYTKETEYGVQKTKTLKEILKERAGHSE